MIQNRSQECKAYLTVYLSLSLTVILSLIMTLLLGARVGAVKMKSEIVTDIAMNSALGEYNRALFDKYGLLFIDTSYGEGKGNVENMAEHIRKYFSKNFELSPMGLIQRRTTMMKTSLEDVKITGFSVASDGGGAVLRRQIEAYMGSGLVGGLLEKVEGNVKALKDTGYEAVDVEGESSKNDEAMSQTYYLDTDEDGEDEELHPDNPAGAVSGQKTIGLLSLAAPDFDAISDAAVDETAYLSHRKLSKGTGLDERESIGAVNKVLLDEYIFEKCGCYGKENPEAPLKYELEYIYAGKGSDYKNLEKVVRQIFLWKEAANFIYIMSDSAKLAEAEALALTASIVFAIPELVEVIKMAIVFSWVFAESISDLRILLSGGKVPLVKTASSWNLSLEKMLDFRNNLKEGGGQGLSYEDYLRMLVFMKKKKEKTMRLMDIIEMNVRTTEGNSGFKMDNCIDIFRASFKVKSFFGNSIEIDRIYGYEM